MSQAASALAEVNAPNQPDPHCGTYRTSYLMISSNGQDKAEARAEDEVDDEQGIAHSELPELRNRGAIYQSLKRGFDILFALGFFLIFWWLFLVVAIGIKASGPGPLIFGHTRVGKHGKRFQCYKFRSMVIDSSEVLRDLLANDAAARDEWHSTFKLKNDPRITRIGQILRRTSLDELPQLWNIFVGDMSVVGPRPVVRKELELYYGKNRRYYLSTRPGLTGPWQVSGRSDTSYEDRVQMDRDYTLGWSLLGDVKIIVQTIAVVFKRKGAY